MRTSSYIIKEKISPEEWAIVHGYSGAIDIVSNNVINSLNLNSFNLLSQQSINHLINRGYITHKTKEEEQTIVSYIINKQYELKSNQKKSFIIVLNYDCNFQCHYCFEKNIHNYSHKPISTNTLIKMLDFIDIENKYSNLTLYGGEPFLPENKEVLDILFSRIKGNPIKVVSNGFNIDLYAKYINNKYIKKIQITIDGIPEYHNKIRFTDSCDNSFNKIISNINLCLKNNIHINLRINCSKDNISDLEEIHHILKNKGISDHEYFTINYAPLIDFKNSDKLNTISNRFLINEIHKLKIKLSNSNIKTGSFIHNNLKNNFELSFKNDTPLKFNTVACNSYMNMYVLDPYGKIYPCWDVMNDSNHCIGTYFPTKSINSKIEKWRNRNKTIIKECIDCPYVLMCGSGCQIKSYLKYGEYDRKDCSDYPYIFNLYLLDFIKNNIK